MGTSKQGKAIVIVGPTSSGKTELSLHLAKKFNGVVISADSRQIYKDMDIATAKTTRDQQQGITHYMIDILSPNEDFNLSHYQNTVNNLLKSIAEDNLKRSQPVIPFIVGGTGLYIKAIINGYQLPAIPPNPILRAQLEQLSLIDLAEKLNRLDPNTRVDLRNKRRVIRALEILQNRQDYAPSPPQHSLHLIGNRSLASSDIDIAPRGRPTLPSSRGGTDSSSDSPRVEAGRRGMLNKMTLDYEFLQIGITRPRVEIKQRIADKITEMYKHGLVKETKKLLAKGYDFTKPAFSAHGYKHIKDYLQHKITLHIALDRMRQDTQRYAKRQMTWFKNDSRIHWVTNYVEAEKLIQEFLR